VIITQTDDELKNHSLPDILQTTNNACVCYCETDSIVSPTTTALQPCWVRSCLLDLVFSNYSKLLTATCSSLQRVSQLRSACVSCSIRDVTHGLIHCNAIERDTTGVYVRSLTFSSSRGEQCDYRVIFSIR